MMPPAWYDLSCRVGSAKAVASCALESMHNNFDSINRASALIAALQDLLGLMQADVNLIEKQLKL